jgi:hypothetical protein
MQSLQLTPINMATTKNQRQKITSVDEEVEKLAFCVLSVEI